MRVCLCGHLETIHRNGKWCVHSSGCDCLSFRPDEPEQSPSRFEQIASEVGRLVTEKNQAYGDAFSKAGSFLALLYPDGIRPEQYRDALALVRIFDKAMRIATRKDAFGESPYRDMMGYALLGAVMDAEEAGVELKPTPEQIKEVIEVIRQHTHDNIPMVEALRKCVGGG